jgi:uncharacterized UBP type Zn finger protein
MTNVCQHFALARAVQPGSDGCEECLASGDSWVHLRMCLICGHVGCCDESDNRHARGHYQTTGHPIVVSHEPGEEWAYCFEDDAWAETLAEVTEIEE